MKFRLSNTLPREQGSNLAMARTPLEMHGGKLRTPQGARLEGLRNGFTLLELLVVIGIIGLLAAIGLPAIRGMTKSNAMAAANRQLLDDLAYARRLAIGNHTTVYMVFISPDITNVQNYQIPANNPVVAQMITNLYAGQYTTYALFSYRSVGDQPGQTSPRYLTGWRSLPNGVYIATNKFFSTQYYAPPFYQNKTFPFPVATNAPTGKGQPQLPYIAFNYLGQLVYSDPVKGDVPVIERSDSQQREYISLAHGSIFYARDKNGSPLGSPPDIQETPAGNAYYTNYNSINAQYGQALPAPEDGKVYNQIYIDPLTGKARVQRQELQ